MAPLCKCHCWFPAKSKVVNEHLSGMPVSHDACGMSCRQNWLEQVLKKKRSVEALGQPVIRLL